MEQDLLLGQLVAQWRARAESCRTAAPARADVYDACAAQLADVLAQAQSRGAQDTASLDMFEYRERVA